MSDLFDLQEDFINKTLGKTDITKEELTEFYVSLINDNYRNFQKNEKIDEQKIKDACELILSAASFLMVVLDKDKAKKACEIMVDSKLKAIDKSLALNISSDDVKGQDFIKQIKTDSLFELYKLIK